MFQQRGGGISDLPPNQTLYVNNLNDKINPETLKKSLREVFAAFGGIMDIIAMKSLKRRGQAWIIFKEVSSATNALRSLQGFPFYNKPMRINFARTKSDAVARADGSYVERAKRTVKREVTRKTAPEAAAFQQPSFSMPMQQPVPQMQMPQVQQVQQAPPQPQMSSAQIQARIGWNPQQAPAAQGMPRGGESGPAPPNRTLFVENLPQEANDTMLAMLFRQYPGFQEVRLIPGRNVAFADYQNEYQSGMAMQGLQGFAMTPEVKLKLSYARK
jgi:U1 small nuclear ribonucleoprotein A